MQMTKRQRLNICEGVDFSYIREDKFKTSRISFTMFLPLRKETASVNAVLSEIIARSCKKYPDFASFNMELEKLYGADIYCTVDKLGEAQVLTVSAASINDDYSLDGSSILSEVAKLLCEVIFSPCAEAGSFRENNLLQAKRQVIENIKAEYSDKKAYARHRCEELMCQNEAFGVSKYGTAEAVESVTGESAFEQWQNNLKHAKIEIMVCGKVDYAPIYDMFRDKILQINRDAVYDCATQIISDVKEVRNFKDTMNVTQCKLTLGFRTDYAASKQNVFPMKVMCALYGGTPNSKLFLNVREEMSLCYYCSCRHYKDKGIFLVESGVESKNIGKAKDEILRQLENIREGKFTDEEVNATKIYMIQIYEKMLDSLSALDNWYVGQALSLKIYTPQEAAEDIKNVTRDEIISAAKNAKLDTIYTLSGSEE